VHGIERDDLAAPDRSAGLSPCCHSGSVARSDEPLRVFAHPLELLAVDALGGVAASMARCIPFCQALLKSASVFYDGSAVPILISAKA